MAFGSVGKARIASSLLLQIAVYYNCIASLMFFVIELSCVLRKMQYVPMTAQSHVYIAFSFAMWGVGEILRLPFAYHGNASESVPSLAAALLVSVFPVIPALMFILFGQQSNVFPYEYIGAGIVLGLVLFEIPLIWSALRMQAKIQKARFVRLTLDHED